MGSFVIGVDVSGAGTISNTGDGSLLVGHVSGVVTHTNSGDGSFTVGSNLINTNDSSVLMGSNAQAFASVSASNTISGGSDPVTILGTNSFQLGGGSDLTPTTAGQGIGIVMGIIATGDSPTSAMVGGNYLTTGADFAEVITWQYNTVEMVDRKGLFVH